MKKIFMIITLLLAIASPKIVHSQDGDSVIVNIFVNRPEKRKQSRWNLFDWMQTKERIKMMDMWLAHNSSNTYMPELTLSGFYTFSDNNYGKENYYLAGMDFYFLPLRFADFGINIDGKYKPQRDIRDNRVSAMALFRIFGTNIQNTYITIKVGYGYNELGIPNINLPNTSYSGLQVGAELQMYLIDYVGYKAETAYFFKTTVNNTFLNFITYSVKGFLEFKMIRFEFGYYQEFNTINIDAANNSFKTSGWLGGLQFAF